MLFRSQVREQLLQSGEDSLGRQQQSVRVAQARGAASRIDVLQSSSRVLQARDARVGAQSDAARAAISSFRALGGGWQG